MNPAGGGNRFKVYVSTENRNTAPISGTVGANSGKEKVSERGMSMEFDEYQETADLLREVAEEYPEIDDVLLQAADTIENLLICLDAEKKEVENRAAEMSAIAQELYILRRGLAKRQKAKKKKEGNLVENS